jgi:peroxiredoxin
VLRLALGFAVAAAVVVVAVVLGRGRGDGDTTRAVAPTGTSASGTPLPAPGPLDAAPPVIGQPAPDFALRSTDGELRRLSDLRGKVVLVNFWATWCAPCKKELPDLQALYDERRADGLEVLTINVEEDAADARAFFDARGLTLPLVLDSAGTVYDQYRLQGLPDSFFVDREGKIATLQFGYLTAEKMRERLAQAGLPPP